MADRKSKAANRKFNKKFIKDFKIESLLNREGDVLPYGYYNPETEGKVSWVCGEDSEGKITSVFQFEDTKTDTKETNASYVTAQRALEMRNELIKAGWHKTVPPKINLKHPVTNKPLTKKDMKAVAKHLIKEKGRGKNA